MISANRFFYPANKCAQNSKRIWQSFVSEIEIVYMSPVVNLCRLVLKNIVGNAFIGHLILWYEFTELQIFGVS